MDNIYNLFKLLLDKYDDNIDKIISTIIMQIK